MKFKLLLKYFIVCFVILSWNWESNAQIRTNGNLNNTIGGENPFMDMSDFSSFANNEGKGLYFPRTDLTTWTFNTAILDGITFSTAYDGMVVYNVGTGQTLVGQGVQTTVSPGYYYFYNPVALGFPDITGGQWRVLSDGLGVQKINDLSDAKSDNDGTEDGSSIYFGIGAGVGDDGTNNGNVGIGFESLNANTEGAYNTSVGYRSQVFSTIGSGNDLSGSGNTSFGAFALEDNINGYYHVAIGAGALQKVGPIPNFLTSRSVAIGTGALGAATSSNSDVAIGASALASATNTQRNIALGSYCLYSALYGSYNIAIGNSALPDYTGGNGNIAIGESSGKGLLTGERNIIIGIRSAVPDPSGDYQLSIGNLIYGTGVDGFETTISTGNIGIGVQVPNSKFEVAATNQATPNNTDGLLIPRINTFPAVDPTILQNSMLVYLTTTDGTDDPGFYYWDNGTTTWLAVSGATGAEKINDLTDAKSDNDGTEDGSSIYFGIGAGMADDETDNQNVGIGFNALNSNLDGSLNTALGYKALALSNDNGNTAIGALALTLADTDYFNTAVGGGALATIGLDPIKPPSAFNVAMGVSALALSTYSWSDTAIGTSASSSATSSSYNVVMGANANLSNLTPNWNVIIGADAMDDATSGNSNTIIGTSAGQELVSGNNNIILGYSKNVPDPIGDDQLSIGNLIYGIGVDGSGTTISTGNIGIGVKVPTEKLEVAGNIYASGGGVLLTDTGVYADYVFENFIEGSSTINKEYTFKTLEEVETFVKANKHLPGVTGINELKKTAHGYVVNITALSGQLLEKVEELFLHTIAQQKKITVLQEKIAVMEAEQPQLNAKDINFSKLPIYEDDTAATKAGLETGGLYKTATGALQIKL